jgi:hypothetical protein
MGRCEFPQPRWFSGEGSQTGLEGQSDRPYPEGVVRPVWLGGLVFEVVSRVVSVLEIVILVVGTVSLQVVSLLGVLPLVLIRGREES